MSPLAVGVILACMVALTAVVISTLLAFRRTAQRAESVLAVVEREIRPMAGELERLTAELQKLSHKANDSIDRIGNVVDRVEDISVAVARVATAVGGLTRVGQYAGLAVGLKRGVEAFLDRIYIVKIPYCLRISEEVKIYDKLIRGSSLSEAKCAPGTLKMMAQFSVLTRLKEPENSSLFSKALVYDGESLKDTDPKAKSYQEYRDYAGVDEGMSGISTRFAFKILSKVFNFDSSEIAANPVHLMYVLEQQIEREQFPAETEQKYLGFIKEHLSTRYAEFIGKEIQTAYLESYSEYGQNIFDRYVTYADYWIQDQEYRDTDTGEVFDRGSLNAELEKIEKPAGISNPKDFRNEIVNFVLRARAGNQGKNPLWTSYEKLRAVIEKKMFSNTEELLPVISFNAKASADEAKKHEDFVNRMVNKGYTAKQVRLLCEWYLRVRKSS